MLLRAFKYILLEIIVYILKFYNFKFKKKVDCSQVREELVWCVIILLKVLFIKY